jgi:hypothetical protein
MKFMDCAGRGRRGLVGIRHGCRRGRNAGTTSCAVPSRPTGSRRGNDAVYARGGPDDIRAGSGNDGVRAADGSDLAYGGRGDDAVAGGDGSDRLYGGSDADQLLGGNGNDRAAGNKGPDVVQGGDGDDSLFGGWGPDRVFGGSGSDELHALAADGDPDLLNCGSRILIDVMGHALGVTDADRRLRDDLRRGHCFADQDGARTLRPTPRRTAVDNRGPGRGPRLPTDRNATPRRDTRLRQPRQGRQTAVAGTARPTRNADDRGDENHAAIAVARDRRNAVATAAAQAPHRLAATTEEISPRNATMT